VTIAAGFCYSDGVLICADSEMTDQIQKFQSSKLALYSIGGGESKFTPLQLVFALAGDVEYARMAITKCEEAVADEYLKSPEWMTDKKIRDVIAGTLLKFHEEFIFCHPLYRDGRAPSVELVIGAFSPCMGRSFLLSTTECAVNEVRRFAFIGSGQSFARYITQQFWKDRLTKDEMYLLAAHVMEQTKQNVPHCGKNSEFVFVNQITRQLESVFGLKNNSVESYSNQFMRLYSFLFYDLADPEKDFETLLNQFIPLARGLRTSHKQQRDVYEMMEKGNAEALRRRKENAKKSKQSTAPKPKQP
jgi:20S proteasome alpha/beta subunit